MADLELRKHSPPESSKVDVQQPDNHHKVEVRDEEATLDRVTAQAGGQYLLGWRLHLLTLALCLSLFVASLETTIVSTSLITITNDLHAFDNSSWIVVAYLLTYTGFVIIWAKASDIFGRKWAISVALLVFMIFSGACGAAQTITQLIVFRVFQGFGGSGIYSLVMVIIPEMVPLTQAPTYGSIISMVLAVAYLLGPLLGGVINNNRAWRWIFFLNLPSGLVALIFLILTIPPGFPRHLDHETIRGSGPFRKIDFVGALLLLAASVFLITALEEAGPRFAWSSAFIIVFLVLAALGWLGVIGWSWVTHHKVTSVESVFPWRFLKHRIFMGMLLNTIFSGIPFTIGVIEIPQRFQAVNAISPLEAGVRLLPFSLLTPLGAAFGTILSSKMQVHPVYIVLSGGISQTIGAAFLSFLPVSQKVDPAVYGYEALLGLGVGLNIGCLMVLTPFVVEKRDLAVGMGAINQFRLVGGSLGLAIATNILNHYIRSHLSVVVSSQQLTSILQSAAEISKLDQTIQSSVREILGHAYNLQTRILIGSGVAQILGSFLMWGEHGKACV